MQSGGDCSPAIPWHGTYFPDFTQFLRPDALRGSELNSERSWPPSWNQHQTFHTWKSTLAAARKVDVGQGSPAVRQNPPDHRGASRTGLLVVVGILLKIVIAVRVSLIRRLVKSRITRRRDKSVTVRAFGAGRSWGGKSNLVRLSAGNADHGSCWRETSMQRVNIGLVCLSWLVLASAVSAQTAVDTYSEPGIAEVQNFSGGGVLQRHLL